MRALSDRDPAIQQNDASIGTLGRRTLVSPEARWSPQVRVGGDGRPEIKVDAAREPINEVSACRVKCAETVTVTSRAVGDRSIRGGQFVPIIC